MNEKIANGKKKYKCRNKNKYNYIKVRFTCPFSKKLGKNFMAFIRITEILLYFPGSFILNASIRCLTYSSTLFRISIPIMRVSGNKGANEINNPPYPQPF